MEATQPNHRAGIRLPPDLEAFHFCFGTRPKVFAQETEAIAREGVQNIKRWPYERVGGFGRRIRELVIERIDARKEDEVMLTVSLSRQTNRRADQREGSSTKPLEGLPAEGAIQHLGVPLTRGFPPD